MDEDDDCLVKTSVIHEVHMVIHMGAGKEKIVQKKELSNGKADFVQTLKAMPTSVEFVIPATRARLVYKTMVLSPSDRIFAQGDGKSGWLK